MRRSRPRTLLLAAAFLAAPARLPAQERGDTVRIDELVVTATRLAVPRSRVPAAVTVIRGEELRGRGVTHALDALRAVAGIEVVQTGSFGATASIFLRGGESDYVQVLVDGVPYNEPGGRADLANLTIDNIDRIEVVRGPASALYGSDAVAGVIQVFTREGQGAPRLTAGVRGGSYGSLAYEAGLSGAAGGARYSFAASRFTSDGSLPYNNQYRNSTLGGRVRLTPDDRTQATLSLRYIDGVYHYPTDGGGAVVDRNAHQLEERVILALEIARALTDRIEGRLLLTAAELDGGTVDPADDAADTLGFYAYRSQDDVRRRGIDARADWHATASAVLTAGFAYEEQRQRGATAYESQWGPGNGTFEADRATRAAYLQAYIAPGDAFSLTLGARREDNDAFGTFDTWRAAAAYRLPTGTRFRAAAGTAFKEPTFFENFAEGAVRGNPDLSPERSRSWEAGLEQPLLGDRVHLGATWFDQRFRDMVQYRSVPFDSFEPNYANIAVADAAGLELEARAEPGAALSVSASYTRLDTRVVDAGFQSGPDAEFVAGRRLLRRPTHAGSIGLGYRHAARGTLDLAVRYTGERDDIDFAAWPSTRVTLPAHVRIDIGGEADLIAGADGSPRLTATLRIENLFNEAIEEVVNFPARGRSVFIGARLDLGL